MGRYGLGVDCFPPIEQTREPTGHQKHELLVCATGRVGRFLAENQVAMERSQWPWDKIRRPMGGPGHDS